MIFIRNKGVAHNRRTLMTLFLNEKPETYSDENCTVVQCKAGGFRSITELLEIVQTYYPKTSMIDILKILKRLIDEDARIAIIWCKQVQKVVVKYVPIAEKNYVSSYSKQNYQNTKGVDGYSINDYLKILNTL